MAHSSFLSTCRAKVTKKTEAIGRSDGKTAALRRAKRTKEKTTKKRKKNNLTEPSPDGTPQ